MARPRQPIREMIQQGTLRFSVGYKIQTTWGFMEAAIFALEGVGATLVAAAVWTEQTWALGAGVVLMSAAVALLLAHLGQPRHAWRSMFNLRQSWVSRGTLLIGGLVALGLLQLALGWTALGGTAWVLKGLLFLDALAILTYPGFVLSSSPAIPFWNSGLMPVLSFATGAASGLTVWLAGSAAAGIPERLPSLPQLAQFVLAVYAAAALCTFAHVAVQWRGPAAAGAAARRLLREEAALFIGAACVGGLVVPAILVLPVAFGTPGSPVAWLVAAAALRVLGDLGSRLVFLRVGLYDPVL